MPSFDVVCRVDLQEVDNAVNQTLREIGQRFDFKGVDTTLRRDDHTVHLQSADEYKVKAVGEILREKLAKREVPAKALDFGAIEPAAGGSARQTITLQSGISADRAREMVKLIKAAKLKVQPAIQADQLRVSGKKRDDLQAAIAAMKEEDFGIPLQFTNFRD
jgi:hypothetical protein